MANAISIHGLSKVYRSGFWRIPFTGLRSLTLDVPEGTAFGFVGPNGAGKTTTIKCLMGLQKPTGGTAQIHGRPIADPECRRRVGFLPERPYFYEHLSAREFLDFYGRLCEVPSTLRTPRIARLLERVDLARFRDVPLGKFSKGMLQRAGLAQALMADPDLLVLDEPMSGLDPLGRVLVRDIILEERAAGKTVVFSSHILSDIETICDRVAIVVGGELRGLGTVAELLKQTVEHVDCEVRVTGDVGGTVLRQDDQHRVVRVEAHQVDALIDRVRAAGGSVLAVHPRNKTLEEVLLDEVERAKPVIAKRLGVLA